MGNWHVPTAAAAFSIVLLPSSYNATIQFQCIVHFLPPEGEVLDCLGKTFWKTFVNELKIVDLYGHVVYQNDPLTKPDFMGMVSDLCRRRRRRQARRRVPRHPPDPQEHFKNAFNVPT